LHRLLDERRKPHLLVKTINNLGAETRVDYAPSTKFYLQDKRDGKPWITRLPFPVHVVERVETYDHISRNRFVTRYAYHHGYFDGFEREFRGFGMVEQWTREYPRSDDGKPGDNIPPHHTPAGLPRPGSIPASTSVGNNIGHFAGFRAPLTVDTAGPLPLDDTIVPPT
jgi:hypothetical protein